MLVPIHLANLQGQCKMCNVNYITDHMWIQDLSKHFTLQGGPCLIMGMFGLMWPKLYQVVYGEIRSIWTNRVIIPQNSLCEEICHIDLHWIYTISGATLLQNFMCICYFHGNDDWLVDRSVPSHSTKMIGRSATYDSSLFKAILLPVTNALDPSS